MLYVNKKNVNMWHNFTKTNMELCYIFKTKLWIIAQPKNKTRLTSPGEHDGQGRQALTEPTQGRPALDIYHTNSINKKNKNIIMNAIYFF